MYLSRLPSPAMLACIVASFQFGSAIANTQRIGTNYLSFQAESFKSNSATGAWEVITPESTQATLNAFGDSAIMAPISGTKGGTVTYDLTFQHAGTYYLYIRASMFESGLTPENYGNEDSFYRSEAGMGTAFGEATSITENGLASDNKWLEGVKATEGIYGWWNQTPSYQVASSDVGQTISFQLQSRERGFSIDSIVFSQDQTLNTTQLDAITIPIVPEPFHYAFILSTICGTIVVKRRIKNATK